MNARSIVLVAMIGVMAQAVAAAQTPTMERSAPRLTLEVLESRTLAQHPLIREAAARVAEARGHVQQAGTWSNPTIGFTAEEVRPRELASGIYGGFIQQMIPLGGKVGDARASAAAEVSRREADADVTRVRVISSLRVRYYEVLAAEERLKTIETLAAVSRETVVIARQLFNVGITDQPDVLTAEADDAGVAATRLAAMAQRDGAWRRLATASGDATLAPQPLAETLEAVLAPIDRRASLDRILQESPELKAANAEITRQKAIVSVQRSLARPDLFLRGDAGWNRETLVSDSYARARAIGWQFGVEVGISVPTTNKNLGGIAASLAGVTIAEAAAAQMRLDLETRWATGFEQFESARAMVEAYRKDILPRVERAHDLYLAKYREMAGPYPQVLMAQRTMVQMNEQYIDALERAWRAALRLQGFVVEDR